MTLTTSIAKMAALVAVPQQRWTRGWARNICKTGRTIHVAVWREQPERDFVGSEVLPLLAKACELLMASRDAPRLKPTSQEIKVYASNTQERADNIRQNYMHGLRSAFRSNSRLTGDPLIAANTK
jgi:hypothetical protein